MTHSWPLILALLPFRCLLADILLPEQSVFAFETRRDLQQVSGAITNYVPKWDLGDLNSTDIAFSMTIGVRIDSGTLTSLNVPVFNTRFGDFTRVPELNVRFLQSELQTRPINVDFIGVNNDDAMIVLVTFGNNGLTTDDEGESDFFDFEISLDVPNAFCLRGDEVGVSGTWASQSTQDPNFIEYVFELNTSLLDTTPTLDFRPSTSSSTLNTINSSLILSLPYTQDQLDFGSPDADEVFFTWTPNTFFPQREGLRTCPEEEQSVLIYVLAVVPASICLCVLVTAVSQRRARNGRVALGGQDESGIMRRYFSGNRDIVLAPESSRNTSTVRAVLESDDEVFDEVVPVSTFRVEVEGEGQESRERRRTTEVTL